MPHLKMVVFLARLAKLFRDPRFVEDRRAKYGERDRRDDKRVVGRKCGLVGQQNNRISEVHCEPGISSDRWTDAIERSRQSGVEKVRPSESLRSGPRPVVR